MLRFQLEAGQSFFLGQTKSKPLVWKPWKGHAKPGQEPGLTRSKEQEESHSRNYSYTCTDKLARACTHIQMHTYTCTHSPAHKRTNTHTHTYGGGGKEGRPGSTSCLCAFYSVMLSVLPLFFWQYLHILYVNTYFVDVQIEVSGPVPMLQETTLGFCGSLTQLPCSQWF
jgi:hypothetical protein